MAPAREGGALRLARGPKSASLRVHRNRNYAHSVPAASKRCACRRAEVGAAEISSLPPVSAAWIPSFPFPASTLPAVRRPGLPKALLKERPPQQIQCRNPWVYGRGDADPRRRVLRQRAAETRSASRPGAPSSSPIPPWPRIVVTPARRGDREPHGRKRLAVLEALRENPPRDRGEVARQMGAPRFRQPSGQVRYPLGRGAAPSHTRSTRASTLRVHRGPLPPIRATLRRGSAAGLPGRGLKRLQGLAPRGQNCIALFDFDGYDHRTNGRRPDRGDVQSRSARWAALLPYLAMMIEGDGEVWARPFDAGQIRPGSRRSACACLIQCQQLPGPRPQRAADLRWRGPD